MTYKERPIWVNNEVVVDVLRYFIKNINRQPVEQREKKLYLSTGASVLKGLTQPQAPGDDEMLWTAIELAIADGVFELKEGKRQPWEPVYFNARLRFNTDFEDDVRYWLGMARPADKSPWQLAVEKAPSDIEHDLLIKSPIVIDGKSPCDIVNALISMRQALLTSEMPLTLRQLSARYLWGVSKALDNRSEEWVSRVLGVEATAIRTRPVHVSVLLPDTLPKGILFIENQDTFDHFCYMSHTPDDYAVVYLAGFKGTATRIRDKEGVRLFFADIADSQVGDHFTHLWFNCLDLGCMYWGDLDYSGLNIAVSLKRIFPSLQWYRPGYAEMLSLLESGKGHALNDRTKGNQAKTCDNTLWGDGKNYLSAIEKYQSFVDQESVILNQ